MQAKTNAMATTAGSSNRDMNLRMNSRTSESVLLNGELRGGEVDHFTFLESKVSTSGNEAKEIRIRISKPSQVFDLLWGTWRSKNMGQKPD